MIEVKSMKAQNGDSFLLSFIDNEGMPRNVLIDGGREGAYYDSRINEFGDLKKEINLIKRKKENIDLLILTHIDNDHICGLLKWFEMDNDASDYIKNIWFNSGKLIAEYLNEPENNDLTVGLKIFHNNETGVNEAIDFEEYIEKKEIWERKIVMKSKKLDEFGVKICVLSPDKVQLTKLLKEYKEKTGEDIYTAGKENDWKTPLSDFIIEEGKPGYRFIQDTSVKNGSSISFIITISNQCFMFLGDSHPKGIVNSLKELGFSKEKKIDVNLLKISHHGSKSNTNLELLEMVNTNDYYISTDSTGHHHPNKRTLARIVRNNPSAVIHFNYKEVKESIMLDKDFKDFPGMKIRVTPYFKYQ